MTNKNAFMIMPFKEPFDSYYSNIYKPALEDAGFVVHRADDLFAPRSIIEDIRNSILNADILLCEMSGKNPNVFYELGLAHAIGKPAILVSNNNEDIPFDFRHIRVILYNNVEHDWSVKLRNKITLSAKEIDSVESTSFINPLISTEKKADYIHKSKVALVNWEKLSIEEQKNYYDQFISLMPDLHKPRSLVVNKDIQENLSKINKINLSPLIKLLSEYSIPTEGISLPLNENEYDRIHKIDLSIAENIANKISSGVSNSQKYSANEVFDYLSCSELTANTDFVDNCDLIVVPGCRKGMQYRLDEAYKLASKSNAGILISGKHSYYDNLDTVPIGEANAMQFYLKEIKHLDVDQVKIYLDDRSRNTSEAVINSIGIFKEIKNKIGRNLNIILVTSPYHMRRFYFLYQRWLDIEKDLVNEVRCASSSTYFDRRFWYSDSTSKNNPFGHNYGISVYIREYFKLIGGRATGEF